MVHPDIEDVLSLTPLQEGLYFHWLYRDGDGDSYTLQDTLELQGPLDAQRLREAVKSALAAHPGLRAAFRARPKTGELIQVVFRGIEAPWITVDLSDVPQRCREAELGALLAYELRREFDLARPPLLRTLCVKLDDEHHVFAMTYHHILLDGWSAELLLEQIVAVYDRGEPVSGIAAPEPVNPARAYGDWLAARDRRGAQQVWTAYLAGVRSGTCVAPPKSVNTASRSRRTTSALDPETTGRLQDHARRNNLTLNSLVQTAWGLLLGRVCGSDDVVYGRTVAGRPPELPGSHDMIGMFTNVVPVRIRPEPGESVLRLCTRVQSEQTVLWEHDHLGLADIQEVCGINDLFDTVYSFQSFQSLSAGVHERTGHARGLRIRPAGHNAPHFPLSLIAFMDDEQLTTTLVFAADAFDDSLAESLAARLPELLSHMADNPGMPVEDVAALPVPVVPRHAEAAPHEHEVNAGPEPSGSERAGIERSLIGLYSTVLGIPEEELSAHDDFFELGGNSLLATRLVGQIRTILGRDLPLRQLFDHPVVADLAREFVSRGA
ncbi:condensation domain-containing protein [Streptomyces sp. NPDC087228]|uniref:condensation domain-containing protein n=1 Tax=Streptomyces sp. NPDC087228 TaxID=3365772 RepID=UPI00380DCB0A